MPEIVEIPEGSIPAEAVDPVRSNNAPEVAEGGIVQPEGDAEQPGGSSDGSTGVQSDKIGSTE